MDTSFEKGSRVRVSGQGIGEVQIDLGHTVIVRFDDEIRECQKCDVASIESLEQSLVAGKSSSPLEVVLRSQAECIQSINNAWGVFARSRIVLLPHQLWVCRKVLEKWPARWLVADDVGLGKTIEAGLILSALLSRNRIHRLLILCPASLVEQWQYRLRTMFDVRTTIYATEADTDRTDFWNSYPHVVASLQSVRLDRKGRHERLLKAEPWDLVIVDEAHHLNADEQAGPTLGFRLIQRLVKRQRVKSMLFFTGTPHRGKPHGFFSLLSLLRPEDFDPKRPKADQMKRLSQVMIRNNKQNVTDLHGQSLFSPPVVHDETYRYTPEEEQFYDMLTDFIVNGKAYASNLGGRNGRAVMLVLIAVQKLASSSVAAILRALRGRLLRIGVAAKELENPKQGDDLIQQSQEAESNNDLDAVATLDEGLAEVALILMKDEEQWLQKLIDAGEQVGRETKIASIINQVRTLPEATSVLFFTEYKATQSLLMSALIDEFDRDAVTFINGDGEVRDLPGRTQPLRTHRDVAAEEFNSGRVRFLVSTEAAGEGIDLQKSCHTLIHVDLPWNPMRLHQRVGRLNRYGQRKQVHVTSFRNLSTVESRIWDKLIEKIGHINTALSQVMSDPEDMYELVLGMSPPQIFNNIFSEAGAVPADRFDEWFDKETSNFGNSDVIDAVRDLVGNAAKFDFQEVSSKIPKVTLQDLESFFSGVLVFNRRQPRSNDGRLSFKTPDAWLSDPAILPSYECLSFNRSDDGSTTENLLGVGHKLVDLAIDQALGLDGSIATLPELESPLFVCRVFDRVTTGEARCPVSCGVELKDGSVCALPDWKLLQRLNELSAFSLRKLSASMIASQKEIVSRLPEIEARAKEYVDSSGVVFRHPDVNIVGCLLPGNER